MELTEFSIPNEHIDDCTGMGTLLITDARLLIRPAVAGQYPSRVSHDSMYANAILNIGNDMGRYEWHIISAAGPDETHELLNQMFYTYVDACCFSLWCDARVRYVVDDEVAILKKHGFEDESYTMCITVHCSVTDVEALVAKLMGAITEDEPLVVVRPISTEPGYSLQGYAVDQSDQDITDESNGDCDCGMQDCPYCDPFAVEDDLYYPEGAYGDEGDGSVSTNMVYSRAYSHFGGNTELARESAERYPGDFM